MSEETIELPLSVLSDPQIQDILNDLEDLCIDPDHEMDLIWVLDDEDI